MILVKLCKFPLCFRTKWTSFLGKNSTFCLRLFWDKMGLETISDDHLHAIKEKKKQALLSQSVRHPVSQLASQLASQSGSQSVSQSVISQLSSQSFSQ